MSEKAKVQERFGLRRPNFILDPLSEEDGDFFAQRSEVRVEDIIEDLQINLVTDLPPKRLFWGPWGGGKTHTLQKTMRELSHMTPIHHVYVECPVLEPNSRFIDLYREGIMRAIGEQFVLDLFERTLESIGIVKREMLLQRLQDRLRDEEMAKAVARLIDPNFDRLVLWGWFSGVSTSKTALADLGQTQDLTDAEPARLAYFVTIVGKMLKELDRKTLVLVLDEMDRMRRLGANTIGQFETAFTRLVDPNQRYVSVLIGCSAPNFGELPDVLYEGGPVLSRLGRPALKTIPALVEPDVEPFIKQIIAYIRDSSADIPALIQEARHAGIPETLTEDFFPFTEEAIQALKGGLGAEMTPREITLRMTHAAGRAHLLKKPVVTSDIIT